MRKLSICMTVKNRSLVNGKYLFPNTIKSILAVAKPGDNLEIVVSDWNSTDYPLETWIYKECKSVPLIVTKVNQPGFNRGIGLNAAATKASGRVFLFTDTDILLNREVIDLALSCGASNTAYFPRVRLLNSAGTNNVGRIWLRGFAVAIVLRDWYTKAGGYKSYWYGPENWGGEDNDFHDDIKALGINTERPQMHNLYHQWHPRKKMF